MSWLPSRDSVSETIGIALNSFLAGLRNLSTILALFGLLAVTVGMVTLVTISEFRNYSYGILGLGLVLLIVALITSGRRVTQAVKHRRGRYSVNTIVMTLVFMTIVGVVNFIFYDNTARVDVTATSQFTLAPRTLQILESLNEPVQAIAFFNKNDLDQGSALDAVDNMLNEFSVRSDKFSYEIVNPNVERDKALLYGKDQAGRVFYGQVVFVGTESNNFEMAFGSYLVQLADPVGGTPAVYIANPVMEQDFVTPLLEIAGNKKKGIYFLSGHGEPDIIGDDSGLASGYSMAAATLVAENYDVRELNLQMQTIVAQETGELTQDKGDPLEVSPTVIVVAGPKTELQPDEIDNLEEYLRNGGKMIFMLDPGSPDSFSGLLESWGLRMGSEGIVDFASNLGGDESTPLIGKFERGHEITVPLGNTYFPGVASIIPTDVEIPVIKVGDQDVPILSRIPLAETSDNSRLGEREGPFITAALVEAFAPLGGNAPTNPNFLNRTSIVIFGDSDFVTNQDFRNLSNADFFLNSVNFLADDVSLINIRPKLGARRELLTTPYEFDVIRYTSWFLIPFSMGLGGAFVWWRRR